MPVSFTDWNSGLYLAHHGIKGQKWGVRNYQDYDGSLTPAGRIHYGVGINVRQADKNLKKGIRDQGLTKEHTIPKGTAIYRTTSTQGDSDTGTTYVSYLDMDRQHYRGGWIRQTGKTGKAFEHVYELQEDIKVPSREETRSVVNEVLSENRQLVHDTVNSWLDMVMPKGSWARTERIWNETGTIAGPISESQANRVWKKYVHEQVKQFGNMTSDEAAFYTMQSLGLNTKVREKVIKKLQDRGFNAMTDEASVGGSNGWRYEGGDPLIIFDRTNMFREVSNTEISRKEENRSLKKFGNYSMKVNSRNRVWG